MNVAGKLEIELRPGALPYLFASPSGVSGAGRPLLVFLHGYDEGPPTDIWPASTRHGPLRSEYDSSLFGDLLIAAPQLPARGDIWGHYATQLAELVGQLHREVATDPRRTYLTGFSFGGNGVFDVALQQPELWAALWAVDPTRVPPKPPAASIWLSFGDIARRQKKDFIEALSLRPAESAIDGDALFEDSGADHVGSARLAYGEPRTYAWLLSKCRAD
jgi:pimeloyl-ACP methyl ester carboxylesterase